LDFLSGSLLVFLGLNFLAAMSGGLFKPDEWYRNLEKPSWNPPDLAFPMVWTVLYLLNSIAGWMVYERIGLSGDGAFIFTIYAISLLLNALWSAIFFGMKRMRIALGEAALLWLSVAYQIYLFYQVVPVTLWMLLPYLAWVSIAVALNAKLIQLNPQAADGSEPAKG